MTEHSPKEKSLAFIDSFTTHRHFVLIVIAFLTFRLLLPFVFRNGSYFVEQAPDIGDYLSWGTLADSRLYPFVNYWSEYPPLFTWSVIGLYRLSTFLPTLIDQRLWFSIVMQLTMTLFDLGSLVLVYKTALLLYDKSKASLAAALFAGAFVTAYAASGWYEPVPLFFLLLALYLALRDRFNWSGLVAGIGLMTKIVPILILPISLQRLTSWRRRLIHLFIVTLTIAGLMSPFLIAGSEYVMAFLRATVNRPSWLSIWALFDGNYSYGATLPIIDRFSPANVGTPPASSLPWPLIHLAFLALFLFLYTRKIDWRDPVKSIAFTGLTVNLFLLWSKGFSGQFTVYLIPFIVLLMPDLRGLLYTALLSLLWVAEWPIAFQMMDGQDWFIAWLVITRTLLLIALCFEYASRLYPSISRRVSQAAAALLLTGWISVAPVTVLSIGSFTQTQLTNDPARPAIDLIRAQGHGETIVFASNRIFRRLYPAARSISDTLLLPVANHTPEDVRAAWLSDLAEHGLLWFVSDTGDPQTQDENRQAEAWMSVHACKIDTQVAGSARVSRFVGETGTATTLTVAATFASEIDLVDARLNPSVIQAGGTLCVELNWQATQKPAGDYTVFVHLVNAQGQLVAQDDLQPQGGFAPTSQWQVGSTIVDKHGLILPENLSAGQYTLQVGMYRSADQVGLPVTSPSNATPDQTAVTLTDIDVKP